MREFEKIVDATLRVSSITCTSVMAMIVAIVRFPLTERFGAAPTVEYFGSPVTVDPDSITVGPQ